MWRPQRGFSGLHSLGSTFPAWSWSSNLWQHLLCLCEQPIVAQYLLFLCTRLYTPCRSIYIIVLCVTINPSQIWSSESICKIWNNKIFPFHYLDGIFGWTFKRFNNFNGSQSFSLSLVILKYPLFHLPEFEKSFRQTPEWIRRWGQSRNLKCCLGCWLKRRSSKMR